MPQEEQSDWPSFETVLREVAPDSPTVRDRQTRRTETDTSPAPAPDSDSDAGGSEEAGSDTVVVEVPEIPELSEPLDLDTSSIRELLKQRTSTSSFGLTEDLAALEPLPDVLDLDNPSPGDLIDDDFSTADEYATPPFNEPPPEPTASDIESAPPPPILATPPAPELESTPDVGATAEPRLADPQEPEPASDGDSTPFSFEQSEDFDQPDISEPLNPFDPAFEGIAEEIVEDDDDGWVTHSLHNIGVPDTPMASSAPTGSPQPEPTQSELPELEATEALEFDPLARMTSSSPFDPPEQPELSPDTSSQPESQSQPAPLAENPFADLLPDATAPSFDVTGLFDATAVDESTAQSELEPIDPVQTFTEPLDLSGLDDAIVFEEIAEPPAPADQLIDFEQYRSADTTSEAAPLPAWNHGHDAEVIPFTSPNSPETPPPPPAPTAAPPTAEQIRPSTENLFHFDHLVDDVDQLEQPRPNWVGLDSDVSAPPPPSAPQSERSQDPWAEMRPNEVPEKISFWENRPKFFGGDERRKARARREAKKVLEESGTPLPQARSCPNCGGPCRVDVQDPSTGRTHVSCNVCGHMWAEDARQY